MTVVNELDALLPQTQCGECGFAGCRPYAEALAAGAATIDKCPPGGVAVLQALASRLQVDPSPYLADVVQKTRSPAVAVIQEAECIGCTKCIQACPVDAIVGSGKLMHAIIPHECTGCGLCVAPCPVDCIIMEPIAELTFDREQAKARFAARKTRQAQALQEKEQLYREKRKLVIQPEQQSSDASAKQDYILQALARAKEKP